MNAFELSAEHIAALRQSAISDGVITARGYRTVKDEDELEPLGFARGQRRAPGLLLPLHGTDGSNGVYVYRPDNPRVVDEKRKRKNRDGTWPCKVIKYEFPKGQPMRVDCPPVCRPMLGNPRVRLWITEGQKKADALASVGECAIALLGVWNFKGKNADGGITILADFDYITLPDRDVRIVFDSDIAVKPEVFQAMNRLKFHLENKKAKVSVVYLPAAPGGGKQGVDDFLAAGNTLEQLVALCDVSRVETEDAHSLDEQAGQYVVRDGRICRRKRTQDGSVLVPLCSFTAQITEEVARDNGVDVTRLLTIEGRHADGRTLPAASVDSTQFAGMRWVTPNFGSRAIVEAGTSAQDHLRAAIQYLSPNVTTRHVYTHTGWREIGGRMAFLTQGGAVGGAPVTVELDKEMERYSLPAQPSNVRAAMETSLRFLGIAPYSVTIPLWSAMFLAPLSPIIPPKFMLWVYGVTGALKSTLAALALSHFGAWTEDDLILWNSTGNSIEKYLFLGKDIPFIVDDFAPQTDQAAARKLENTAGWVVRGVGNRSARARMNGDLSLRTLYRPRGLVISTGEQLPDGQSLTARLVTVEMERRDVDIAKLSEAQDERDDYPHAMAGYLLWLADQWKRLEGTLPNAWRDLRTKARQGGQHLRLPESIASLYTGLDLGLTFAVETGALDEPKAAQIREEGWAALIGIAERQHRRLEEERPTRRFLTVLTELLAQSKVRLNGVESPNESGDGDLIGWRDEEYIYLLPSVSFHRVAQFERDGGRHFGVKENTLRKALGEEGILTADDGHHTARARIGGQQRRVLKLVRAEVEKISGGSLQKAVTTVTGS